MSRKKRKKRRSKSGGGAPPSPGQAGKQLQKAADLLSAGDAAAARRLAGSVLATFPRQADALNIAAMAAYRLEENEEALQLLRKACEESPRRADIHCNLGTVLFAQKDYPGACQALERALELQPDHPDATYNLARVRLMLDRADLAVDLLGRHVATHPRDYEAMAELRQAATSLNRPAVVTDALLPLLQQDADNPDLLLEAGQALTLEKRLPEAASCLRRACHLRPEEARMHRCLGNTYTVMGKTQEALESLEEAVALEPENARGWSHLGNALQLEGDLQRAEECYRRAIELRPDAIGHYGDFFALTKVGPDDPTVAYLERVLNEGKMPRSSRWSAHFALGKVYDRAGEYATAFDHYRTANDLKAEVVSYDRAAAERFVDQIIATCNEAFFERFAGIGNPSDRPIFIVGMPRSGTTLTEQILASHPRVAAGGELSEISQLVRRLAQRRGRPTPIGQTLQLLAPDDGEALGGLYLRALAEIDTEADRVTDKMPGNFNHLGLMAVLFPQASFIHCRRHPLDTCLSCYFQNFTNGQFFSYRLEDLGHSYRQYRRLIDHWQRVLPQPLQEARYEDVVEDLPARARELVAHCDLEWDERCLAFHRTERVVQTASKLQVRQPIYRSSLARWQRYEPFLGPLKESLGDVLADAPPAPPPPSLERETA